MTIKEMKRFCADSGQHEFLRDPFRLVDYKKDLVIACDGSMLLATEVLTGQWPKGLSVINGNNGEKIKQWLDTQVPEEKYCIHDLDDFLSGTVDRGNSDPIKFGSAIIDRVRLQKMMAMADEPYRYSITPEDAGHKFTFKFSRYTAIIMGMKRSTFTSEYIPKVIK